MIGHFFVVERIPFFSFLLWIRQSRQAGAIGGAAGAGRGGALGGGDHVDGGGGGDGGLGGGLMERGGKPPVARNSSSTLPLVHSLPGSQNNSHLIMMEMKTIWLQWWGWWLRRVTTSRSLSPGSSRSLPSWQQWIFNNRSKRATPALLFLPHQRLLREVARPEVGLGNSFVRDQDNLHDERHDDRRDCWRNLFTVLHYERFDPSSLPVFRTTQTMIDY